MTSYVHILLIFGLQLQCILGVLSARCRHCQRRDSTNRVCNLNPKPINPKPLHNILQVRRLCTVVRDSRQGLPATHRCGQRNALPVLASGGDVHHHWTALVQWCVRPRARAAGSACFLCNMMQSQSAPGCCTVWQPSSRRGSCVGPMTPPGPCIRWISPCWAIPDAGASRRF
jgi:hypothetical protein